MTVDNILIFPQADRPCRARSGCDVACGMSGAGSSINDTMLSIEDFQRLCGRAEGTSVHPVPSPVVLESMARAILSLAAPD